MGSSITIRIAAIVGLLICRVSCTSHASPSSSSSSQIAVISNIDILRALYVKKSLTRRLYYVETGKRMRDFAKWIKEQGGQAKVFSMHGVETDLELLLETTRKEGSENEDTNSQQSKQQQLQKQEQSTAMMSLNDKKYNPSIDPFAKDRMNLQLVSSSDAPPDRYRGKTTHISDTQPPNLLQLSLRALVLSVHFCPVLSTLGLAVVSKRFRENYWYSLISNCMAACGPAFIKWGQWSSTRNDLFPDALCDALASLHNDAPAHGWTFSQQTVEASLGLGQGTLFHVFDDFESTPMASGSIAQVHKAILNGELVAVKIRHPRVAKLMEMDFRLMGVAALAMDHVPGLSWLRIRDSVEQFSHTMAAQSYLQVEAHHLEVLNYNFRDWPQVRFPLPFYASEAVIIETFEPGKIVTGMIEQYAQQVEAIKGTLVEGGGRVQEVDDEEEEEDKEEKSKMTARDYNKKIEAYELIPLDMAQFLVTTGVGVYFKMLLVDGLMHADLHPGNILVDLGRKRQRQHLYSNSTSNAPCNDGDKIKPGCFLGVTLVDAGMVAQLSERESSTFIGLLASIGEGNGREAATFALQFSMENNMGIDEREAFTHDMDELFQKQCHGYHSNMDVGLVLRGILGLIRKHRVRIDANYATLVVNALCIESLARMLCPSYNVIDAAKPLLRTYKKLCYRRDGTTLKPNAPKSTFVQAYMRLMYLRKNAKDKRFFKREARRRRRELQLHKLRIESIADCGGCGD